MSSVTHCSECGAELPTGLLGNRCPRCLLQFGLAVAPAPPAEAEKAPAPEVPPSPLGKVHYFGDYELLEEIARGGMGIVYKARQVSLNRLVAVKMILFGEFARPHVVQRFRREAEAAARLQHPNIVAVHEVGEHEGQHYFSMDFVEGQSLGQLVGHTPLPAPRAARYVQILAEAIDYAHQQGVLHRDLKPSNVLIDRSDQPRITDFGLARRLVVPATGDQSTETPAGAGTTVELTLSGQVLGTPSYTPPEQAVGRREQVGPASDVYGLGAILYYLVTGRPPFVGETVDVTLAAVLNQEPVSPRAFHPSVPRDLETVCLKCLEKEPSRRYGTAKELAEELGRFLGGQPVLARPAGLAGKVWRWCQRRPVRAGLIAALIAVFALGLTGVLWQWQRAEAHRREAEATRQEAIEKLWGSYLAQARANRWSGRPGRRFDSLDVLAKAASIRPSFELRNEAIACLALPDVQVERQWRLSPGYGIAFDPAVERYAQADESGVIRVRRVSDHTELLALPAAGKPRVVGLVFSPNGQFLAEKYEDTHTNLFRVWDLAQREVLVTGAFDIHGFALGFSPNSRQVAAAGVDGTLHLYDLGVRKEVKTLRTFRWPRGLSFDPRGERLVICSGRTQRVEIIELDSGQVVHRLEHPRLVHGVCWSPKGNLVACACFDRCVHLWDGRTGEKRAVLEGHTAEATGVVFDAEGDLLVSYGWDGRTWFWDPIMAKPLLSIAGALVPPFGQDDQKLGWTILQVDAGVWRVSAARECRRLGIARDQHGIGYTGRFSPDGRLLATTSPDGVRLWDLGAAQPVGFLPLGETHSVIFDAEGKSLVVSSTRDGLQRWPLQIHEETAQLQLGPPRQLAPPPGMGQVCLSRDGQRLARANNDQAVVLDLRQPNQLVVLKAHRRARYVALRPDGAWVATGTWQATGVKVSDARTGELIKDLPVVGSATVAFSPDGHWLVTGAAEEYRFWRAGTWEPGLAIPRDRVGDLPGQMAFSPDSAILALLEGRNSGVKLMAVATGQELATLEAGPPLDFSPDGCRLATIGEDKKTLLLWDLRLIRQQLAAMKLDWELPPMGAAPVQPTPKPLRLTVLAAPSP